MKKPWAGWRVGLACLGVALGGISCSKSSEKAGTGGAGGAGASAPLGQDSTTLGREQVTLEVDSLSVSGSGGSEKAPSSSFVTGDPISVKGSVRGGQGLDEHIQWHLQPVLPQTADADPTTSEGPDAVFRAFSRVGTAGSRTPNPPLEYELVAALPLENGKTLQVRLPPTTWLKQDEEDVLRQEYLDFGTSFRPSRAQISVPSRPTFNTGNYSVIAQKDTNGLAILLDQMQAKVDTLLNNDVQEKPVGTRGLTPSTVVVSPGPPILTVGALGDTDPQGDDVCASPLVGGRCNGAILAGPNGIAETRANNRGAQLKLADIVSSAFRNPQRNRAAGSVVLNSIHTQGGALDIDPRLVSVPGKSSAQLMCIIEAAGDSLVGAGNSFTEKGAAVFLPCDSPSGDHVHVER